jgi:hypothetical protein
LGCIVTLINLTFFYLPASDGELSFNLPWTF